MSRSHCSEKERGRGDKAKPAAAAGELAVDELKLPWDCEAVRAHFGKLSTRIGCFSCQIRRLLERLETPRILRYAFPKNEALAGPEPS
jgi:hypothetical protein